MPCVDRGLGLAGLKTFAWTPGGTPFLVVLMTIHEPEIVAVLEADTLGQLRTAAASAVAAKHLARAGASSLGVIGCGRQAASHVAALRAQLPSLSASSSTAATPARATRSAASTTANRRRRPRTPAAATSSSPRPRRSRPSCRATGLSDGALVLAVGANDPDARELDDAVLERTAAIYVDSREQAREEAGDLIEPAAAAAFAGRTSTSSRTSSPALSTDVSARTTCFSSSRAGSPPGTWRSLRAWSSSRAVS